MLEKLKEINYRKSIIRTSNCLIILLLLHLLFIFMTYYSIKFNFANPLLPKLLAIEVFAPYAQKGLIIMVGLLIAMPLKFFKQNLFAVIIYLVLIALYYLTSFEPNFAEYQK
nr:hypothetical protein [uncultured Flavobacterium sp.]